MSKRDAGILVFLATIALALDNAFVRLGLSRTDAAINPAQFAFARYGLGLVLSTLHLLWVRRLPRASKPVACGVRAVSQFSSVVLMYLAVAHTTLAESTFLLLSYPVLLAVLHFAQDRSSTGLLLGATLGLFGTFLVAGVGVRISAESIYGILAAVSAGASVLSLSYARQQGDSLPIVWWMFLFGTVCSIGWMALDGAWIPLRRDVLALLGISGIFSVAGLYFSTIGAKAISYVTFGVIASSRIFIAALLGPWIAGDPWPTPRDWIGGVLIFAANVICIRCEVRRKASA